MKRIALSRRELHEHYRKPFFLYVDEFQNFANEQFEEILTESRKYGIFLTMAHQSLSQLDSSLKHITLGNTDIHCFFRVESSDTEPLGKGTFEARGGIPKQALSPYEQSSGFLSEKEEVSMYRQQMNSLENRFFFYRHKGKPYKARLIRTSDLGSAKEESKLENHEFYKRVKDCVLISKQGYTRSVREIRREKKQTDVPQPSSGKNTKPETKPGDIVPDIADFRERE